MSNSPYATSFSLKTLDHLGINLYGNAPAVIAELVANAHDAGALRVDITVNQDRIIVQDDGFGMSLNDINTKYLRFGYEKRRDLTTLSVSNGEHTVERHVMGRKGIGKISALSIARELELQTVHGDERNGFVLDLSAIEQLQAQNSTEYRPDPLPADAISIGRGTQIELRHLVGHTTGLDDTLRQSLARMFPLTGSEVLFDIYINGEAITMADRPWFEKIQFLWYFGADSEKFASYCPRLAQKFTVDPVVDITRGYTITGWIGTTLVFSDVPVEQKIVPVYAQNKMIQRDLLYDYKNYKLSSSYLVGEIYAPFMDVDTEPDIVLTDRQRLNPNDPRYSALRRHVVRQVEEIDRRWNRLRNPTPKAKVRKPSPKPPSVPPLVVPSISEDTTQTQPEQQGQNTPPLPVPPSLAGQDVGNAQPESVPSNAPDPQAPQAPPAPPTGTPPVPARVSEAPPRHIVATIFGEIDNLVQQSNIENVLKDRIRADLRESSRSYDNSAFKACIVMLGAVLEGVMLGVLRQPEAVDRIATTVFPQRVETIVLRGIGAPQQRSGMARSDFAQRMADDLKFEMMRELVEQMVPHLSQLRVDHIQHFRNAIHPWRAIAQPAIYGRIDHGTATQYIMSCRTITQHLVTWIP